MLQVLLFTHDLKYPMTKSPISLSEAEKRIIADIQIVPRVFFKNCGDEGKKTLEQLEVILKGEEEWTTVKEQWKDKKKSVLHKAEDFAER